MLVAMADLAAPEDLVLVDLDAALCRHGWRGGLSLLR
jgi:hypothetical protein